MLKTLRKRYPQTADLLILIGVFVCVIVLAAIWQPFVYIMVVIAGVWLIAQTVRSDLKKNREN